MRLRAARPARRPRGILRNALMRAAGNRDGNIALSFAVLAAPLLLAIGIGLDYGRAYNVQSKMQSDLDAALIAAVKDVDDLNEKEINEKILVWFAAQADNGSAKYTLSSDSITVNKANRTITAVASGVVPATILNIVNIKQIPVSVASSVAGPATSFLNVYLVLDKSASMLLAATTAGQTSMRSMISCEFACHATDDPVSYGGVNYPTYYAFAKAKGIQLRADLSVTAAKEVLDMIAVADPTQSRIKVGLYTLGATATEELAPTYSTATARTALTTDSKRLNSATSIAYSYFDKSLPKLKDLVGEAGDGSSASKPMKLVLMLTDGVQSERNWVLWWSEPNYNIMEWKSSQSDKKKQDSWKAIAPLNPAWCSGLKTSKVTVGVLYTQYLAIPNDWGYASTVGATMKSADWKKTWGGAIRKDVPDSTTKLDYIPYALKDCASSESMFISAADPVKIEQGLSKLFEQYLANVRLTQ